MSLTSNIIRQLVPSLVKGAPVPYSINLPLGGLSGPRKTAEYLKAYGSIGWLHAVVSRIGFSVGEADWQLYRTTGQERVAIDKHPLTDLLAAPNAFFTGQELWEMTQMYMDLAGEAFIILNLTRGDQPVEMWPVAPQYMKVAPAAEEFIGGYVYKRGAVTRFFDDPKRIIHLRYPSPISMYRGLGPVQSIAVDLDTEVYAAKYNRNFFLNSARPDAVLEATGTLSTTEYKRLKSEWAQGHKGVERAHRIAILEAGLKYKQISLSQMDMGYGELRKLTRDMILGAYGMPRAILGITEGVNYASAKTAEYTYARWVIRPRLQRIKRALNQRLAPMFGDGIEVDFTDPTPENREADRLDAEAGMRGGFMMIDESRRLLDLDPLPGGRGQIFIWGIAQMPTRLDASGRGVEAAIGEAVVMKGLSTEQKELLAQAFVKRQEPGKRKFKLAMDKYFMAQGKRIVTQLRRKGHKTPDDLIVDDEFWLNEIMLLAAVGSPLIHSILEQAALQAIADYGLDIAFDVANPMVQAWIGERLRKFSTNVSETTKDKIIAQLREAYAEGEGIPQMVDRIKEYYDGIGWRAERVARTEVVGASSRGAHSALVQGGVEWKQWWSVMDGNIRDAHAEAHEQVRPINQPFLVMGELLMHPGEGSPENSINCRCAELAFWPEDEA